MTETNNRFSPFYKNIKYYRNEIEYLKKLKCKSKFKSYAFFYLCLLSKAVCRNVDTKNKTSLSNKPNTYIKINELCNTLGVKYKSEALNILEVLKETYHSIDFEIVNKIVYIYFTIKSESMPDGDYSRHNTDAYKNAMSIKNNEGFILIDKYVFFNTFFNNTISKGIQDFYVYLRLNTVYNDENLNDYIPKKLRNKYITLWKPSVISFDDTALSVYAHQNDFARLFNVNEKTIQRYLKALKYAHMLSYYYINKRGTTIVFSFLNKSKKKHLKSEKINFKKHICEFIAEFKEKFNEVYSFVSKKFTYINIFYSDNLFSEDNFEMMLGT